MTPDPICWRCDGTGYRSIVPGVHNPFLMCIETIARAARRVMCTCVRPSQNAPPDEARAAVEGRSHG